MANPDIYADFVEFNVSIVAGSTVGASLSRCCLVSEFEPMDEVFEGRTLAVSGTANEIRKQVLDLGFLSTSATYKQVDAFLLNVRPIGEVLIGRRDGDDADLAASMAAIIAEDDDFFGWCLDSRLKAEQLYGFTWSELRGNKFFLTYSRDPLALQGDASALPKTLAALQIKQGMLVWYDPQTATKYGPAVLLSTAGTFDVPSGGTLKLRVAAGSEQTFTFPSAPATLTSGTDGPYVLSEGESMILRVNQGALVTVTLEGDIEATYFPDGFGAATAVQVAAWLNDFVAGLTCYADGDKLVVATTRRGTGAHVEVFEDTGGDMVADLDLPASEFEVTSGTVVANAGDTVGLDVDALADLTVVSTASAAGTAILLQNAWNASAAHYAVATALAVGTAIQLTFKDHSGHTVASVSPATADITPIAETNAAVDAEVDGTGFAADASVATGTEVAALIEATLTAGAASAQGAKFKVVSDASGSGASIEVTGGTLVDEFGLELGLVAGVGTTENYLDCQLLGRLLSFDLDSPNGSVGYDNQTVPQTPGNVLTSTQRHHIWDNGANTFEAVTTNRPGELHPGICPAKFDADVVVGAFWFRVRGTERIKLLQDTLADRGEAIPYSEGGIAKYDQVLRNLVLDGARNGIIASPPDLLPPDPLGVRKTYFRTPTIAEQKPSDRAVGRVRGFTFYQKARGSLKSIVVNMTIETP